MRGRNSQIKGGGVDPFGMKVGLKCTRRIMMCKWTSHAVVSQLYAVIARATSIHSTPKCPNYCMHQVQLFCYCMVANMRIASRSVHLKKRLLS